MSATPCPLCDDTGWKAVGEGRERRVVRCECRQRTRTDCLVKAARIPRRYQHCDLGNFEPYPGGDPSLAKAKLLAERFVANYVIDAIQNKNRKEEVKGLLLVGPVGVGKTHLAVGIIKELILKNGIQCLFYDYRELLKEIRNSYNPSVTATEMDVLRPALRVPVLVLDELGAERPTDWVWDTVSHILNTRYNEKRTTIITTNYEDLPERRAADPLDNLARAKHANTEPTLGDRITERMRSRLHEMCRKIELQGQDFRLKIRSASFCSGLE